MIPLNPNKIGVPFQLSPSTSGDRDALTAAVYEVITSNPVNASRVRKTLKRLRQGQSSTRHKRALDSNFSIFIPFTTCFPENALPKAGEMERLEFKGRDADIAEAVERFDREEGGYNVGGVGGDLVCYVAGILAGIGLSLAAFAVVYNLL